MDEEYWAAFPKRLRDKTTRQGFLIIGPIFILVGVWSLVAPIEHSAGDIRDSLVYRLATAGVLIAVGLGGIITSARWLIADRRK